MHYILIDDNSEALALLMQAVATDASSIVAVWPNTKSLEETNLLNTKNHLETTDRPVNVRQVQSQADLATLVATLAESTDPTVLCSDLTMKSDSLSIGLEVDESGWLNARNVVRDAFVSFSKASGHLVCIHSGIRKVERVAKLMGGPSARIFPLTGNFELSATIDQANGIAEEIKGKIAGADHTPLEKFWANASAKGWFSKAGNALPHDWPGAASTNYRAEVTKVFSDCMPHDFPAIPSLWWTESFHESLKGVTGGEFCGTEPDASGVSRSQPLRLGGVALIAALAYANKQNAFHVFDSPWHHVSSKVAPCRFLSNSVPLDTKRVAIAFWFFFSNVFATDKHSGKVVKLTPLTDGFEISFNWDTGRLFRQAREETLKQSSGSPNRAAAVTSNDFNGDYPKPSDAKKALADILRLLAFEPGRILSTHYGIRIQAVSEI